MGFFATLKQRWVTVLVTLGLAFASGYIMENELSDRSASRQRAEPPLQPEPPSAMQVPSLGTPPMMPGRARERRLVLIGEQGCTPRLFVNPAPAATLRIDLYAPCRPDADVTLRQGILVAALKTDARGRLHVRIPALDATSEVALEFEHEVMTAMVEVPGTDDYRHVILAWDGPQALRINAYEFGASKAEMGHVWAGSPKSPARAVRGSGGFLTRIGNGTGPGFEIYSFPLTRFAGHGVVRLVVEAEVTEANCARDLRAEAFRSGGSGRLTRTEIALAMPECDRVGEIVRLQNLLRDMRLATR